jgi:hypothetical protein
MLPTQYTCITKAKGFKKKDGEQERENGIVQGTSQISNSERALHEQCKVHFQSLAASS